MPSEHGERGTRKFLSMHVGVVVSNKDPLKMGRCRIRIPGVYPDGGGPWALPLGWPAAGSAQRGYYGPPPEGADVGVLFNQGDPDAPYYISANPGQAETPSEVSSSSEEDATKVQVFETDRWRVILDNRTGQELLSLRDKTTDDVIEIDGVNFGIRIKGTSTVLIESEALLSLDAPMIQIGGRPITKNRKPIN